MKYYPERRGAVFPIKSSTLSYEEIYMPRREGAFPKIPRPRLKEPGGGCIRKKRKQRNRLHKKRHRGGGNAACELSLGSKGGNGEKIKPKRRETHMCY